MRQRKKYDITISLIYLIKPLLSYMLLAVIMGVLGHLCASAITILSGYAIVDILNLNLNLKYLIIMIMVCAICRGIFRYIEQTCNHYIAFKILAIIRDKVFNALRRLAPAKLEGKEKGNLITLITSDIELLEVFYAHTISPVLIASIFSLIMIVFIGTFHPLLSLIAIMAYSWVGIAIPLIINKLNCDKGLDFRNKSGELSNFVLDSLRGLFEVLQFDCKYKFKNKLKLHTENLIVAEEKMKQYLGINLAITNASILFFDFLMLIVASFLYQNNDINFAGVLIPTLTLFSSFGPVIALANLGSTLQNTYAAGNKVLDILEETPLVVETKNQPVIEFEKIETEKINFAYDNELILSNVSLNIPKGSIIGIMGSSGSGKSTLLKLLMRFWDVKQGRINISNVDIKNINTHNLREMESFVTQDTHLFHDSIKNNIRIAKLDASDEEIENACKKAAIHEFILTLPKGYDTLVGELGDTLSSGQKQRIGLARAFLHDAPLMLLDEPTSNLDSLNEAIILKSINEAKKDKTIILVSHRKSTMKIVENIYSVNQGRVS